MKVEPAKPARPRAAGGAIGRRKIVTWGSRARVSWIFWDSEVSRDILVSIGDIRD